MTSILNLNNCNIRKEAEGFGFFSDVEVSKNSR